MHVLIPKYFHDKYYELNAIQTCIFSRINNTRKIKQNKIQTKNEKKKFKSKIRKI
jgi:hypothetical protein